MYSFVGFIMYNRFIVVVLFVGLVLGNFYIGIVIGLILELVFMGVFFVGVSNFFDFVFGFIIVIVFVILMG